MSLPGIWKVLGIRSTQDVVDLKNLLAVGNQRVYAEHATLHTQQFDAAIILQNDDHCYSMCNSAIHIVGC